MKNIILFILFCFSLNLPSYSQVTISDPVRLTSGNNDRNPSFRNNRVDFAALNYDWEFMVFERIAQGNSNIWISKITDSGSVEEYKISDDSFENKNPSISYNETSFFSGSEIKYAVIVWQSDQFGRQSIFASRYLKGIGWSSPFIVDSSNAENTVPKISSIDSLNYSIAYQSNNDIKYKKYNIITNGFSNETNITVSDTVSCSNPQIKSIRYLTGYSNVFVTFERLIAPDKKGIYIASGNSDSIPYPRLLDTMAFAGNNRNLGIGNDKLNTYAIFESDRNGTCSNIFGTSFVIHHQHNIVTDMDHDIMNYAGGDFGITDLGDYSNLIYAYNIITLNSINIKINFGLWPGYSAEHHISNDLSFKTSVSINSSIKVPNSTCERFWFVYNKDSMDVNYPSTIYGVYYTNCLTSVNQNVSIIPEDFYLSQNYPNPFNPSTNIEFRISSAALGSGLVSLIVYDMLGNEIATLVNEKLPAGSYSVIFDGSNLASGIYFYKLTLTGAVGEFSEVKKMSLLK